MLLNLSVSKIRSRALLATSAHGTFSLFEDGRHVACIDSLAMSCAMMRGMTHFITTSSDTYSGALIDAALYSRMLCIHF